MSRADIDQDDPGFASPLARDGLLLDEVAALRREVGRLRGEQPASRRRGPRRSLFDPNPAVSGRTVRRRTGIALCVVTALVAVAALYLAFALLSGIAHLIGDMFAPRLAAPGIVVGIAAALGIG